MPSLSQLDDEEKKAPDFRSRYPAETAVMPTDLAAIASRNLAGEDASIAKVNAVARMNPLPAPGSTYATPETDTANMSIANAMDRADLGNRFGFDSPQYRHGTDTPTLAGTHLDDIATRRDQLDSAKKQIQAKLGLISPSEAGFNSTLVFHDPNPQERKQLLENWHMLDAEDKNLLHEHQLVTTAAARDAHENFVRQNHINANNDFTGLATDLADLHKNAKPGTPEFAAGVLDIATRHPTGFQTQAGQSLVRSVSALHDNAAVLEDRSYWQRFGQAFKEASQTARKRGVDVQYDDQGFPSTALTAGVESDNPPERPEKAPPAAYVKQAAALAEMKAKKDAAYNANPKADLSPHDRNITIEQAKLDAMKEALGMTEPASPPPTTAADRPPSTVPPAVPDLKSLAAKALADPKASEAHKAAARKILGQ